MSAELGVTAELVSRKNDQAYEVDLTADSLAAVDWHVARGYAGPEFLFSKTGASRCTWTDSHLRPLKLVQQKLGLRLLGHHKVGRVSVHRDPRIVGEDRGTAQGRVHRSPARIGA